MTQPIDNNPTPEFRAHLEWEIARAARREMRFGPAHPAPAPHRWRTATLITVCLAMAMAVSFASAQVRGSARRDSLVAAARADLQFVMMRRQLAQQEFDQVRRQQHAGVVGADALAAAEVDLRAVESRLLRGQLDIREIEATALPPRNELTAPRVDGHDYVAERLKVDLMQAQRELVVAESAATEAQRRARIGVEDSLAAMDAKVAVARAESVLSVQAERLRLRTDYLDKGGSADELATRLRQAELQQDLALVELQTRVAHIRVTKAARNRAVGAASELDLMRAQLDVKELELELSRLMQLLKQAERGAVDTSARRP